MPRGSLHKLFCDTATDFPQHKGRREWERAKFRSCCCFEEMMLQHFYCFLFIKSKSLAPGPTQEKRIFTGVWNEEMDFTGTIVEAAYRQDDSHCFNLWMQIEYTSINGEPEASWNLQRLGSLQVYVIWPTCSVSDARLLVTFTVGPLFLKGTKVSGYFKVASCPLAPQVDSFFFFFDSFPCQA